MNFEDRFLQQITRRHFFRNCQIGLGSMALASLLGNDESAAAPTGDRTTNPLAPRLGHHPAKATNVIFLFMAGAPASSNCSIPNRSCRSCTGRSFPSLM